MQKTHWFAILACFSIVLTACFYTKPKSTISKVLEEYNEGLKDVSRQTQKLIDLAKKNADKIELQGQFKKARSSYKRIEWLTEYYYPNTAKTVNGPALEEVEPDEKSIIVQPEGFQVIEQILFTKDYVYAGAKLLHQAKVLHSNIGRIRYMISIQETTDAHIFDALRLEIFRIIALGISGFDSPLANNSLQEAAASLKSMQYILSFYSKQLSPQDKHLTDKLKLLFDGSIQYLSFPKGFNSFDRMKLITQYLNPASENLLLLQLSLKIPLFTEPRALRAEAKSLFAKDIFNPDFYTPNSQSYGSPEKVKLGRKLFFDGILSGDGKRSCATCHQPGKAFTDGLKTSFAVNGKTSIRRNAPTLIDAALQPSLFYDMRVNYLEDQAKDVISNKDEMHGSLEDAVKYVNRNAVYKKLFKSVYKDEVVTDLNIKNCIAAYIRSLVKMDSRFDQYMRGNFTAMTKIEIDGFNLFTGKAKCGTCHFVPLFNGSNPPIFDKIDAEVIGVPATPDSLHAILDADPGKYDLYKVMLHKNAFKTPTLRNVGLTAPYMHNGVFKTLEEVVEFYNRGGGAGLGIKLENQTLPEDRLNLSNYEKKSLIAFMTTLTDTSGSSVWHP